MNDLGIYIIPQFFVETYNNSSLRRSDILGALFYIDFVLNHKKIAYTERENINQQNHISDLRMYTDNGQRKAQLRRG